MSNASESEYREFIARKRREYGAKFSDADLAPQFRPYLRSGQRIRVRRKGSTYERTGTVGVTTGWRPAFLLMRRANAHGSSDVLSADDQIVAVQRGGRYVPVTEVS